MRTRRILVLLLLGLVPTSALDAQELRQGATVRLHLHEPPPRTGRVDSISRDTLWLRVDRFVQPISLTSVRRAELRQRAARAESGWTWAKRGFIVGAVLGGITCLADQENCVSGLGPGDGLREGLLAAALFYGGGTAFLGFIAGVALPGHQWVEIPVPRGE